MSTGVTQSRLAVLLFTDIVGSTELKSKLGTPTYTRLLERQNELFESLCTRRPGTEILKHTGDGYLAAFPTASDVVNFALLFQESMRQQRWEPCPLTTRIGIHIGEVAVMPMAGKSDIVGLAADLAARVMSLAQGGQILLTREAFNNARQFISEHPLSPSPGTPGEGRGEGSSLQLKWLAHGAYLFKGSEEPLDVFEVGADGLAPLHPPENTDKAKRIVPHDVEQTLGWRPAIGLDVPTRMHWKLEGKLGEGGFGEVWLAQHGKTKERRVFKFCFDVERLRSFKRELTLFRLLRDALGDRPDIAKLYEVKLDEPPFFLESEYAPGGNLTNWAERQGGIDKIPLEQRLEIVAKVADAVAAAHSVGILHKDIKPSNILVYTERDGTIRPRLSDFGIGMLYTTHELEARGITHSGFTSITIQNDSSRTGTQMYSPPELLANKPFTIQGDIYALGVLLYQLVIADLDRPLAPGWERQVEDDLLREDIAACVDGDPQRRLTGADTLARRIRELPSRRAERATERLAAARTLRRRAYKRLAATAFAVLLLLSVAMSVAFLRERDLRVQLKSQTQEAEARRIEAEQRAEELRRRDYANSITLAQASYDLKNIARMQELLERCPQDLRAWEWYRLRWLSDRSLMSFTVGIPQVLRFSKDGQELLCVDAGGHVRRWDLKTATRTHETDLQPWRELTPTAGPFFGFFFVQLSHDGRIIAACLGDERIQIHDAETGTLLRLIETPSMVGRSIAFIPGDQRIVLGDLSNGVQVYDVASGARVHELRPPAGSSPPRGRAGGAIVAVSPDGQLIAASWEYGLAIWEARSGQLVSNALRLAPHPVEFSSNGEFLATPASIGSSEPHLLDPRTLQSKIRFVAERRETTLDMVSAMCFNPDGMKILVAGQMSRRLRMFNARTGATMQDYHGHTGPVAVIAVSPDGSRIATGGIGEIKIWDAAPKQDTSLWTQRFDPNTGKYYEHETSLWGSSSDGKILASTFGALVLLRADNGTTMRMLHPASENIVRAALSADGRRCISLSYNGTLTVFELNEPESVRVLADIGPGGKCCMSSDGRWVAAAVRTADTNEAGRPVSNLRVWDLNSQRELRWNEEATQPVTGTPTDKHEVGQVLAMALSSSGRLLSTVEARGNGYVIVTRDTISGNELKQFGGFALRLSFSPDDSKLIEGFDSNTGTERLWEFMSAQKIELPKVSLVCVSPDSQRVAGVTPWTEGPQVIKICDINTGQELLTFFPPRKVNSLMFTGDGRRLLAGTSKEIIVFDSAPRDAKVTTRVASP